MKKSILISTALILAAQYFASSRKAPMSAQAAEARRTAFLIRLGVDNKADVDWSGSIEPSPGRATLKDFFSFRSSHRARLQSGNPSHKPGPSCNGLNSHSFDSGASSASGLLEYPCRSKKSFEEYC